MTNWYQQSINSIFHQLNTSLAGLTTEQATERLSRHGQNVITSKSQANWLKMLLEQFKGFFVILLIMAGALAYFIGDRVEATIILAVVVVNVIFGFVQEFKANRALAALKTMMTDRAKVRRLGRIIEVDQSQIVPGDIIILDPGVKVPADGRLINLKGLKVDESPLTGESVPVVKQLELIEKAVSLGDQTNMVFAGTLVVLGRGEAIVVSTGNRSEFGKIAQLVTEKEEPSPLEQRLQTIGQWFTIISFAIAGVIFLSGFFRDQGVLELLIFVIALLVAAVPESLPTIVTLALAIGVLKLTRKKAVVKRLPIVETLGDCEVIATDKTGTLTANQLTVTQVVFSEGKKLRRINIQGNGYEITHQLDPVLTKSVSLNKLLQTGVLASDAQLKPIVGATSFRVIGDPTEGAILILARKAGISEEQLSKTHSRLDDLPFDSKAKFMASLNQASGQINWLSVKGATEVILKMTNLSPANRTRIQMVADQLAAEGLRVLAIAGRETTATSIQPKILEKLDFLGLVGLLDPIRDGVKAALVRTESAGIKTIMITGDHRLTAIAIAEQLGMKVNDDQVLTGKTVDQLTDSQLTQAVKKVVIFARTSPEGKLRIINALKKNGSIVAVTGDGVNDAPALKAAHIGIAMGGRGTDVARESADLVLLDDSFATIIEAVTFGRGIFDNIRKFMTLLLAGNLAEVLVVGVAFIINLPAPFAVTQLLWINLVTDSFPALALAFESPKATILKENPTERRKNILGLILNRSISLGLIGFGLTFGLFLLTITVGETYARSATFTMVVLFELVLVFSLFRDEPFWQKGLRPSWQLFGAVGLSFVLQLIALYGPLAEFFDTERLGLKTWLGLGLGIMAVYLVAEIVKALTAIKPTSDGV